MSSFMRDFVAIDFETANRNGSSICSMGAVIVRDGRRCDDFYSLVRPAPNYYSRFTTAIHGLTRADTDAADHFRRCGSVLHLASAASRWSRTMHASTNGACGRLSNTMGWNIPITVLHAR